MATQAIYGKSFEDGREEAWAEATDYSFQGDSFIVRITALYPYKDYANDSDELLVHLDYLNVTQNISGRYERVLIPSRANVPAPQGEQALRRHSTYTLLTRLLATTTPDVMPSPVYPAP